MNMEALEKKLQKETELAEKHKQMADDIRKQILHMRGKALNKKIAALDLTAADYDKLMKLLSAKKTLQEAMELILGNVSKESENEADQEEE